MLSILIQSNTSSTWRKRAELLGGMEEITDLQQVSVMDHYVVIVSCTRPG